MKKAKLIDLSKISTESRNPNSINIDKMSSLEIATLINKEDNNVIKAINSELKNIAKAIDLGEKTLRNKGRIVYIGAGTSGRLGVLDASEMPPTFNVSNNLIIGIIAGGDHALRNPIEGAEDSTTEVLKDLKKIKFSKNDILVGIAASGRTPYVISGLEYAKKLGSKTISISTSKDSQIGKIANIKIEPVVGSEVITGSTRMKSGTAQKLVLNMISTGVMVKLGKVYKNLMVDLKPSNEKLVERAIKIISEITNAPREKIILTLKTTKNNVKESIVMINKNVDHKTSVSLLNKANGILSKVID